MVIALIFIAMCIVFYAVAFNDKPIKVSVPNPAISNSAPTADKKDVNIPSYLLEYVLKSLFIGWFLVLAIEHTGKFSFMASYKPKTLSFTEQVSGDTPIAYIDFNTPFGNQVRVVNPPMNMAQLHYDFGYSKKLEYYISATKQDFLIVILFTVIITSIFIFFRKFKVRLT